MLFKFKLKIFDINNCNETIKDLVKLAEKNNKHIKNINLMIDTPDMFSRCFN